MTLDASRCWQCVRTDFGVADAEIGSRQPRRARRYCWVGESGEIRFDEGERVSADGSPLRATDLDGDWDAFDIADEETVMAAAAQWSINPSTLDERDDLPPHGLLGFLVRLPSAGNSGAVRSRIGDDHGVAGEGVDTAALTARWQERCSRCRPIGHELRGCARAAWVRFHTLPGSKRYADDESEYAEILRRHHVLLGEIPGPGDVITAAWSASRAAADREPQLAAAMPDAAYWMPVLADRDDTGWESWVHLYVSRARWRDGELDPLLRLVADDETRGVIITPPDLAWLYHPYDGGADVITRYKGERDALARRHNGWLPANPSGL